MTTNQAEAARFWDKMAPSYAKKPVPDEEAYRLTLERAAAHLKTEDRTLEIGCGTGTTALKLAPSAGHILATDVSPQMIEIAREKARISATENVTFEATTLDDSALVPGSFDVVMAFNFFHLLPDIPGSFRRCSDLLKPGGLFIQKTPCIGEDSKLIRLVIPLLRALGKAPFVNYLTQDDLRRELEEARFEILETALYPAKSHNFFLVARRSN